MKAAEYMSTQQDLVAVGRTVERLDLNEFLRAIAKAEALTPVLDPTMYRKAQANLHGIKRLAESLLPVQAAFRELRGAVLETAAAGFMEKQATENKEDEGKN